MPEDAHLLEAFYHDFEPRGFAMGLPPMRDERTHDWLDYLGSIAHSFLALNEKGVIGHAILAESRPGEAELAIFVHQNCRRLGVGTALTNASVAQARELGYKRLWAAGAPANVPAIRMVLKCGFRRRASPSDEMELDL